MKVKKITVLLFIIPFLSFSTHKYYLSLTQINYKSEAKAVQIIINVFMDDIETALNKDNDIDLQLTTKKELKNNDMYFKQYLEEKLTFKINGTPKNFNYIGKEYDGDLVFFYLEIENIPKVTNIEVKNTILTKHFETQQNLVKCKLNKKNKSVLLTKEENNTTFNY